MATNRDLDGHYLLLLVNFCKSDAIKIFFVVYNAHLEIINIYAIVIILCQLVIEKRPFII